jgi:hypothetical protein
MVWPKNGLIKYTATRLHGDGGGKKKAGVEWIDACFDVYFVTLR